MTMKRIGILYHPLKEAAYTLAKQIEGSLKPRGLSVWLGSAWEWEKAKAQVNGTDLILTVGGDGTILRYPELHKHHGTVGTGGNNSMGE